MFWFFTLKCLKIIFIFVFEFSLFHSELEYNVQSPLGYQGNTDQAHSWTVQSYCLFFPCCTSLFPNPFDLSLAGPCGLILLPTRAYFLDFFLKVLTQRVSIIIKSQGWYFSVWLEVFCSLCALRAVGGWSQGAFWASPEWPLSVAVCAVGRGAAGAALLHGSYPGDAFIQQVSNSTSDSGAVRAMPESSLLLNCSANKKAASDSYLSGKAAEETFLSL